MRSRISSGRTVSALLFVSVSGPLLAGGAGSGPPRIAHAQEPLKVYLPYLARHDRLLNFDRRVWGLQFALEDWPDRHERNVAEELPRAYDMGLRSVRTFLRWDHVEPRNTSPEWFDWSEYDKRIADYSAAGFDVVVGIVAYPSWATRYQCGYGLLDGMEPQWREFVREAARRYAEPPFDVVAWEIGNEVDGKSSVAAPDCERPPGWGRCEPTVPVGGCWGERAEEYKVFLQAAYEEIKAVAPDALVTHGGLAYADLDHLFKLDFLGNLLEAGGGPYFDILNYHWFPNVPDQLAGADRHMTLMVNLIRHDIWRPVWLTETYRLTYPDNPDIGERQQIRFLTHELPQILRFPELERIYWYGWTDFPPGYRRENLPQRGLVTNEHEPKPALFVLPHLVEHSQGWPWDIYDTEVEATRFSFQGSRNDTIIAQSRSGSRATLRVTAGTKGLPFADVITFPEELLLSGTCCLHQRVWPSNGQFRFTVQSDSLFITLPAE